MKKIDLLLLILLFIGSCTNQQEIPDELDIVFKGKFSDAVITKWEFEDGNWEADFKQNNIKYSAVFNEYGNWVETEHEIIISEIPSNVYDSIKANYQNYKIKEVEYIESVSGVFYEVDLKRVHQKIEITYDVSGNIIKKDNDNKNDD